MVRDSSDEVSYNSKFLKENKKGQITVNTGLGMACLTAAAGSVQLQIALQSAQQGPQHIHWIQKTLPSPHSWAKAKSHKTMTCQGKAASDVEGKATYQTSRITANLLGKMPTGSF